MKAFTTALTALVLMVIPMVLVQSDDTVTPVAFGSDSSNSQVGASVEKNSLLTL